MRLQWGSSEACHEQPAGGGKQRSYGKTKCEDPITLWNTLPWHFAVKRHFQVVLPTEHHSVCFFSSFCKSSLENAWTLLLGFWEAGWFVFPAKLFPSLPESAAFPREEPAFLPLCWVDLFGLGLLPGWCCSSRSSSVLQQVLPPDTASPGGSLAGWRLSTFLETGREEEPERWEA